LAVRDVANAKNEIPCRDCGLSLWDPEGNGRIYFDCQVGCVPDRIMAVSTARRFVVSNCPMPRECRRHGAGPGTLTVFDVAAGKMPAAGGHGDGISCDVSGNIGGDHVEDHVKDPVAGGGIGRRPQDGAKARPPDTPPSDPVSRMLRKRDAARHRKEDQRLLGDFFEGARPSGRNEGAVR